MSESVEALSRLHHACGKALGALSSAGDDLVADLGLSTARLQLLDALAAGGPRSVSQIARALGLSRQAVQRVADDLVGLGLAVYGRNPDHARAQLLTLTDQGRATWAQAARRKALWLESLADGLTPGWLDMAAELMTLLARRAAQRGREGHS